MKICGEVEVHVYSYLTWAKAGDELVGQLHVPILEKAPSVTVT
jgi:hypothetical protein